MLFLQLVFLADIEWGCCPNNLNSDKYISAYLKYFHGRYHIYVFNLFISVSIKKNLFNFINHNFGQDDLKITTWLECVTIIIECNTVTCRDMFLKVLKG